MKNFKIVCISVLLLGLMAGPAIAQIGYSKDILEPGNPPGGTCDIIGGACTTDADCAGGQLSCLNPTLKTWDETWDLPSGQTMDMDIWNTDVPDPGGLLTSGVYITFDSALVNVTNIIPWDTNNGGLWDPSEPFSPGPGAWIVQLLNFSCVAPDADGDVFLATVTFQSLTDGQAEITISPIPDFDTVVGCAGTTYDSQIAPNIVTINPGTGGCQSDPECDDTIFCNGAETCDTGTGECLSGTPPTCDDGVACTDDICDTGLDACENIPNDSVCDDGLYCNGVETCDAVSGCQAGTPPNCDDGVDCTVDTCDEGGDTCVNTPDDLVCDDGDACNGDEFCDPASDCQPGTPLDCDDGDLCTDDSCDTTTGCVNIPVDCPGQICNPETGQCEDIPCTEEPPGFCDDGIFCNGAETCDTGTGNCQNGTVPDCDDGVACTDDVCDTGLDACDNIPNDGACDDADVCTGAETCDPVNDCQAGDPLICEDGNLCTTDSCDPVAGCMYTPVECPTGESCDPADGQCVPDGGGCDPELCDDGLYCNGMETCVGDVCTPGTAPDCDDGVGCTDDICDEDIDTCVHNPNDGTCDNGDVCDGAETCDPVSDCQAGDPLVCDDGNLCTTDDCEPQNGCVYPPVECPTGESCDPADGQCVPAGCDPPDCDDGNPCTVDVCNVDTCENTPNDGLCDDGNVCNGMETCDALDGCQAGTPPNCDDGVDCTDDTCDEVAGCRSAPNDDNCQDDGLYCNGEELCDPVNDCYSTGDPCPSGTECNEDTQSCDSVGGLMVYVDIDPYACPNPLNMESGGKIRVTIMGTSDLDVESIDQESLMLSREGVEGGVAPVTFYRDDYMDRGRPYDGKLCSCPDCDKDDKDYSDSSGTPTTDGCGGDDGYADLTVLFRISELVEGLKLYEVEGQTVPLTLTGVLKAEAGGTPISGKDCVDVMGQCKGDFDCDADVDGKDTDKMKKNFGWDQDDSSCDEKGICSGDFDKDGDIDSTDINAFKKVFGNSPKKGSPCGYEECAGDFDCDTDVDGQDAKKFTGDFGRSPLVNPCDEGELCVGDFDDDKDCDGTDAAKFKKDFGRSWLMDPCKGCVVQ